MTPHTPHLTFGWLLVILLVLSGCNTTPIALEQANHTVSLLAEFDEQSAEYRAVTSAAEKARLASLEHQKTKVRETRVRLALDSASSLAAGDKTREPFARKLLAGADKRAKVAGQSVVEEEAYKAKLTSLLTPQLDLKPSITQAQVDIAPLGQEISAATRLKEFRDYFSELAANLKANKKKIDDAELAAKKSDTAEKTATDSASSQVKTAVDDAVTAKSK